MILKVDWQELKSFADERGLSIQYVDFTTRYFLCAIDGAFELSCTIDIESPASVDQDDFETNYMPNGNILLEPKDLDSSILVRTKAAPQGWTFQARSVEFETSQLSSMYSKKNTLDDYGDCTIKFYDSNGTELTTQGTCDSSCVKTVLDFEPVYDFEIIGGLSKIAATPTNDVRLWVVGVPDVSVESGGSKEMISGINLKFITANDRLIVDGRTSKRMAYNATYHTNKLRIIVRHTAGEKHKIMMVFEYYKL